jgi:hypothetical protein
VEYLFTHNQQNYEKHKNVSPHFKKVNDEATLGSCKKNRTEDTLEGMQYCNPLKIHSYQIKMNIQFLSTLCIFVNFKIDRWLDGSPDKGDKYIWMHNRLNTKYKYIRMLNTKYKYIRMLKTTISYNCTPCYL